MKTRLLIYPLDIAVSAMAAVQAQSPSANTAGGAIPVTVHNFIRAESDLYMSVVALKEGGFGKFEHHRELSPVDAQTVVRQNRDNLYSAAVFDLDAGPVTITLPDAKGRFMSMQSISQDEYASGFLRHGPAHSHARKHRHSLVLVAVRTLVDPSNPADIQAARALRDAIKVEQPNGPAKMSYRNGTRLAKRKCATDSLS